jgi:hypothetical protein
VKVRITPERVGLQPGASKVLRVTVSAAVRPAAPGALTGAVRAGPTTRLRIPWATAVPVTKRPVVSRVALTTSSFRPSDRQPVVLTLVAGRVDGSPDRPQLLPLLRLELDLYRGARRLGTLARLRDVVPGRYAFGVTGRGPRGARLRPGRYELRVIGAPVGGGRATVVRVPFRLR